MNIPMEREVVRSDEEWEFVLWLREAVREGLVLSWDYESKTYPLFDKAVYVETVQMKTKVKHVERFLLHPAEYTPDFSFVLTEKGAGRLLKAFKPSIGVNGRQIVVDIKGSFNPRGGDDRHISLIQKAMFHLHGVYVQKIVPKKLFAMTYAPEKLRWMQNRNIPTQTALGRKCMNISEFTKESWS